jgi:hypothetical protein
MAGIESKLVKAGARTYFFDIKEAKNGKKYLVLTESRLVGDKDKKEHQRSTIIIFPEQAKEFAEVVNDMTTKLI